MTGRGKITQNQPVNRTSQKLIDTRDEVWTTSRIKYELELRGYSLSSLSRQNGLHSSACGLALKKHWPKFERIIADALDISCPSQIFPDRYGPDRLPIKYNSMNGNQNALKRKSK